MAKSPSGGPSASSGHPTPEERAEVVIMRLERFIRDHRTTSNKGMSFRKWQDMGRAEIADMIRDAQSIEARETRLLERALILLGAGLATVGLWGTALAIDMAPDRVIAGILTLFGGFIILWAMGMLGVRTPFRQIAATNRRLALERVRSLNRKVTDLEHALKKRHKALEKELDRPPLE
ncbi:MAG: hypothetical protein WCZ23_08230 [Rhodospirillaceae bacterium]